MRILLDHLQEIQTEKTKVTLMELAYSVDRLTDVTAGGTFDPKAVITEAMITAIPTTIVITVFLLTPFHSFNRMPHIFATKMMNDMCRIHELAPLPILLSPIP